MSQNNSLIIYAGVDVAKDSFVLHFQGRTSTLANDAKGCTRLVRILQRGGPVQIILEATGGYEQAVVRALHAAGIAVSVLEPSRVRAFAKAQGRRAKTDPIDAGVLCAFGEAIHPAPTLPPSAEQSKLAEWVLRRRQLLESVVAESNRSAHYLDALSRRQAASLLRMLRRQISQCDQAIAGLIASDAKLQSRATRMQEVPGVGATTAAILLAEMPELGTLSSEGAAALAGVAPYNCDSGPWKGCRRINGGRVTVRCALHMASLSASRYDPILRTFHQRLLAAGKKKMVALTAVMRKLIVLLNRLLKHPNFQLRAAR
jgi:transposase